MDSLDCLKVKRTRNCDEGKPTKTTTEQVIGTPVFFLHSSIYNTKRFLFFQQDAVEGIVERLYNTFMKKAKIDPDVPLLLRKEHIQYLIQSLTHLPPTYAVLKFPTLRGGCSYYNVSNLKYSVFRF